MCDSHEQVTKQALATEGLHHLGLTVPNVHETATFFSLYLGFNVVAEKPDYPAIFISDGAIVLTLWQVKAENFVAFDRRTNVGLHHFALKVASQSALDDLYEQLKGLGDVTIEFAPESQGGGAVRHMMCTVPGGLRVEFLALPE